MTTSSEETEYRKLSTTTGLVSQMGHTLYLPCECHDEDRALVFGFCYLPKRFMLTQLGVEQLMSEPKVTHDVGLWASSFIDALEKEILPLGAIATLQGLLCPALPLMTRVDVFTGELYESRLLFNPNNLIFQVGYSPTAGE